MIDSVFIKDVLDLTFDDFRAGDLLRKQIPFLVEGERQHTGIGIFIHFKYDNKIEKYKIDSESVTCFDSYGKQFERLNGVEIRNESLSILADTYVILRDGLIDHIEIFNKSGDDYPLTDPEHYELHQMWLVSSERRTIIK